jgi:hypothetical protein
MQTTSLDIIGVTLSSPRCVSKLLRERKIPLDRVAIVDTRDHALYVAVGTELSAVHDPYTGDQVEVYEGIQNYIGDYETLGPSTFHTVFLDPETGSICNETGLACKLVPVTLRSWTSALLELTFGK